MRARAPSRPRPRAAGTIGTKVRHVGSRSPNPASDRHRPPATAPAAGSQAHWELPGHPPARRGRPEQQMADNDVAAGRRQEGLAHAQRAATDLPTLQGTKRWESVQLQTILRAGAPPLQPQEAPRFVRPEHRLIRARARNSHEVSSVLRILISRDRQCLLGACVGACQVAVQVAAEELRRALEGIECDQSLIPWERKSR